MEAKHIFHGLFIHSISEHRVEFVQSGLLIVDQDGHIAAFEKSLDANDIAATVSNLGYTCQTPIKHVKILKKGEFLIPGFVHTHNHAPQWGQRGLGRGLQILEWLDKITFPNESKFKDTDYARICTTSV